jgi:hypothetical protein
MDLVRWPSCPNQAETSHCLAPLSTCTVASKARKGVQRKSTLASTEGDLRHGVDRVHRVIQARGKPILANLPRKVRRRLVFDRHECFGRRLHYGLQATDKGRNVRIFPSQLGLSGSRWLRRPLRLTWHHSIHLAAFGQFKHNIQTVAASVADGFFFLAVWSRLARTLAVHGTWYFKKDAQNKVNRLSAASFSGGALFDKLPA